MAELATLARPYARAVFAVAQDSGAVDAFYGYLDGMSVGDLVAENTGLRETLSRQVAAQ